MSITNELLAHMSYTAAVKKNNLREQLDSDLEAFLKNGGQITTLKGTEIKPLPPRSVSESPGFASPIEMNRLIRWCQNGKLSRPRRQAISEHTGIDLRRIRSCLHVGKSARLTKGEYARIKAVLKDIEDAEVEWGIGV